MKAYKYRLEELSMYATLEPETVGSLLVILTSHPDWTGVWAYDEFAGRVIAHDPPIALRAETEGVKSHDVAAVKAWLQAQPKEKKLKAIDEDGNEGWRTVTVGRTAHTETISEAMTLAAHANRFHPVRDFLDGLEQPSLDDAHATLDGVAGLLGIEDEMGWFKRQLVAAVRRIRRPGYKHDYILVLVGETQGQGKSTLVNIFFDPWFQDNLPDLGTKQAANALRGFWGIELAELEKVIRADDATVKAFLSRTEDVYDQKYERDVSRQPRQCVFYGTTNQPDCLRDPTGNRRYWPVRVTRQMDLAKVTAMRASIWAAANVVAETDFRTWMTAEEEQRANEIRYEFTDLDPWHRAIAEYCAGKATVTVEKIWEYIATTRRGTIHEAKGELVKLGKAERNRIGATLRFLKCKRTHGAWRVPDELSQQVATTDKDPPKRDPFRDPFPIRTDGATAVA